MTTWIFRRNLNVQIKIEDKYGCGKHPARIEFNSFKGIIYSIIIYFHIPSNYVIGEKVKINFSGNPIRVDLMELIYECLEHEIMHYVLTREFDNDTSKKLDAIHEKLIRIYRKT